MLHYFIFSWFLVSWAEVPMPAEIRPYINRFVDEARSRNVEVPVTISSIEFADFSVDKPSLLGECMTFGMGIDGIWPFKRFIRFDKWWWDHLGDMQREQVLFHELGHCVLDWDHVDEYFNIMFPNRHDIYDEFTRDFLLDKFFVDPEFRTQF